VTPKIELKYSGSLAYEKLAAIKFKLKIFLNAFEVYLLAYGLFHYL